MADEGDKAATASAPAEEGAPAGETGSSTNAPTGDGEIVGGPRNMQQIAAQRRLQQTHAQVNEVVDLMKVNVEKVIERDAKLSELSERADALNDNASMFKTQAHSLKNKFWLEHLKMMIISGVLFAVGIFVIYGGSSTPYTTGLVLDTAEVDSIHLPKFQLDDRFIPSSWRRSAIEVYL